jgi:hypothetical protein
MNYMAVTEKDDARDVRLTQQLEEEPLAHTSDGEIGLNFFHEHLALAFVVGAQGHDGRQIRHAS